VGNVRRVWIAGILALTSVALAASTATAGQVNFTDGVASGDVTSTSAILWTRVDEAKNIHVEGWTRASLRGPAAFRGKMKTSAARDYTVKIDVGGLQPDMQYWYRFRKGNDFSPTGTFRTAPDPNSPANVKFTYTGDSDGTKVNGVPTVNNFETLSAAQQENGAFWIYLGDTIYSDSSHRPNGPATTLADYRAAYREARSYPNLTNLLASTSTYALMDDHEVVNDYTAETVDPARYAAGREAFLEYMPIRETGLLHDPSCAGDPLYRTYHWGSSVDMFVLDERSCRTAEATAACHGDLGPTLPSSIRTQFPFNRFLTPSPPEGCLTGPGSINDPARTILGPVQKAQFESDLLNSTAQYKMIVNEDPIQQLYVLPYDRWEGYGADRTEILNLIRNNGISNVLFLTTDMHATVKNQVFMDRFSDFGTIANEMVTGPIATTTYQNEVIGVAGTTGLFAVNSTFDLLTIDCRNLNQNSYALVDTAAGGTTTITSKTDTGVPVSSQQNLSLKCAGTYGP
jgi:alkaline phosphatase D